MFRSILVPASILAFSVAVSAGSASANCGQCGAGAEKPGHTHAAAAETPKKMACAFCAQVKSGQRAGQLCPQCTTQKLGVSGAQGAKLAAAIEAYNKKIAAAQAELLRFAQGSLASEAAKKLEASLKPAPKAQAAEDQHGDHQH